MKRGDRTRNDDKRRDFHVFKGYSVDESVDNPKKQDYFIVPWEMKKTQNRSVFY